MSRGDRYKRAREWKPFRNEPGHAREPEIGPRGEVWLIDEALTPIEKVDEKLIDTKRAKS